MTIPEGGAKMFIFRKVLVIYPAVSIDDVSGKLPKSVSNFLFSGLRIIGRAPVVDIRSNIRSDLDVYFS